MTQWTEHFSFKHNDRYQRQILYYTQPKKVISHYTFLAVYLETALIPWSKKTFISDITWKLNSLNRVQVATIRRPVYDIVITAKKKPRVAALRPSAWLRLNRVVSNQEHIGNADASGHECVHIHSLKLQVRP